jgi:hypothetical protein
MSGDIIDFNGPLEERQFRQKEQRLKAMREAFRASRLAAAQDKAGKRVPDGSSSRRKNSKPRK